MINGEEVLPPYLSEGFRRSLSCLVQIHISPRQNNIIRFLHLDEIEGRKKRVRLFLYKSVRNRLQKLKTDCAFDVDPASFLPHGGLEGLTGHHWFHKADLGGASTVSEIDLIYLTFPNSFSGSGEMNSPERDTFSSSTDKVVFFCRSNMSS